MARLDRYVLREILPPLAVAIAIVVIAVFLFQARRLATAALGLGLEAADALVIFVAALPPFLMMAVPIAYLLSVLVALGRLAVDLELTAIIAAGAGPFRIARVPILLGAIVAALMIPVAVFGEPYGLRLLHARLVDVGLRNLTRASEPGVFNEDFRGSAVYARGRDARGRLTDVLVYDERDPTRPLLLIAREGAFSSGIDRGVSFDLREGEIHLGAPSTTEKYDRIRFEHARVGLDAEQEISRRTGFVSIVGRLTSQEMLAEIERLGPASQLGRRIEKTYWRRFAFPSMAFVLGIVASAIALGGGARSRAKSAVLGMLSVIGYYVLTRIADFVVVQYEGTPFWMAWAPNVLVLILALLALARAGRAR